MAFNPKPKPTKKDKPKKRKKKTPRQILVRNLDAIIREIVMMRDVECVRLYYKEVIRLDDDEAPITKTGVHQLGHVISRARLGVRWDLRNCHRQDSGDNLLHEYYPEVYNQWYINTFGLDSWNRLVDDSRPIRKYTTDDLETLLYQLTEIQKYQERNTDWKPYYSQKDILTGEWRFV